MILQYFFFFFEFNSGNIFLNNLVSFIIFFIWKLNVFAHLGIIFLQCLSRALRNENPKFLMAASAVFLPIQPLMVSAVHTGMMEVTCHTVSYQLLLFVCLNLFCWKPFSSQGFVRYLGSVKNSLQYLFDLQNSIYMVSLWSMK